MYISWCICVCVCVCIYTTRVHPRVYFFMNEFESAPLCWKCRFRFTRSSTSISRIDSRSMSRINPAASPPGAFVCALSSSRLAAFSFRIISSRYTSRSSASRCISRSFRFRSSSEMGGRSCRPRLLGLAGSAFFAFAISSAEGPSSASEYELRLPLWRPYLPPSSTRCRVLGSAEGRPGALDAPLVAAGAASSEDGDSDGDGERFRLFLASFFSRFRLFLSSRSRSSCASISCFTLFIFSGFLTTDSRACICFCRINSSGSSCMRLNASFTFGFFCASSEPACCGAATSCSPASAGLYSFPSMYSSSAAAVPPAPPVPVSAMGPSYIQST
mmetsp:Transcript_36542/g.84472  ORF Transcript_36542/g.84472 Transcript_36542/m.84472 type:complete len:330 (+) Transcript_36542:116-1105(+)